MRLVACKSDEEWDYGTVYQKEHCKMTLALSEEIDIQKDEISVIVKKDVVGLDAVPAECGADRTSGTE